jgi:hypothetical protein
MALHDLPGRTVLLHRWASIWSCPPVQMRHILEEVEEQTRAGVTAATTALMRPRWNSSSTQLFQRAHGDVHAHCMSRDHVCVRIETVRMTWVVFFVPCAPIKNCERKFERSARENLKRSLQRAFEWKEAVRPLHFLQSSTKLFCTSKRLVCRMSAIRPGQYYLLRRRSVSFPFETLKFSRALSED